MKKTTRTIITISVALVIILLSALFLNIVFNLITSTVSAESITNETATVKYLYNKLGDTSRKENGGEPLTTQKLCEILSLRTTTTTKNYEYYRSHIKDTSNRDILKCYSEGLITVNKSSKINPNNILTKKEVREIIGRINKPLNVERPVYKAHKNIPILMYHEVGNLPYGASRESYGLYVTLENFIQQIEALQKNGYNTVSMDQVYQHWVNKEPLPEKPIVITFDDGYPSHYNLAAVELGNRGMTGTFYIITKKLYEGSTTPPESVKEMYQRGMEVGSHTVNHINSKRSDNTVVHAEYKQSKEMLESILGTEIRHFAYPYGGTTEYAEEVLKELGYVTSPRTTYGVANYDQGLMGLHRIRVDYSDTINSFLIKIMQGI